jgi:Flp pilus assembly pilin Flp
VLNIRQIEEHNAKVGPEDGQTMAEYGLVLSMITLAVVLAFTALSGGIIGAMNRALGLLPS